MSSIFDLKTSTSELMSANNGTSRLNFEQFSPTRDVTGSNFPGSRIIINFEISGVKWWIPSRSYLRLRSSLTKLNGTQLDLADQIAPNMGLCSNLFQSCEFLINDKIISRVGDFVPQIDALQTRLNKSKSWLDSVGSVTNFWDADILDRQAVTASDGRVIDQSEPIADIVSSRIQMGFDLAGGVGNNRNAAEYSAATGIITFSQNGGAALPPDVRVVFPVGSFFTYLSDQAGGDGVINVQCEVLAGGSATTIRVRPEIPGDVALDGRNNFTRTVKSLLGQDSRRVSNFENVWVPPLSIFNITHALPAGKYQLILTPQSASAIQTRAIQSLGANKDYSTDFKFEVDDLYFYCNTVEGPRVTDSTYLLDLESISCSSEKILTTSPTEEFYRFSKHICFNNCSTRHPSRIGYKKLSFYF